MSAVVSAAKQSTAANASPAPATAAAARIAHEAAEATVNRKMAAWRQGGRGGEDSGNVELGWGTRMGVPVRDLLQALYKHKRDKVRDQLWHWLSDTTASKVRL
jgi:hypothetical protein